MLGIIAILVALAWHLSSHGGDALEANNALTDATASQHRRPPPGLREASGSGHLREPARPVPPQSLFAVYSKVKQRQRASRLGAPVAEDPHFRVPSLFVTVRELFFIPVLLWVGFRSKSRLLLGIVVVQLLTHFCIVSTSFRCNPRPWCNIPALAFGFVYLALGTLSLQEQLAEPADREAKDERQRQGPRPKTYFDSVYQALFVIVIGIYIVGSHTWAIYCHQHQYEEFPQDLLALLFGVH